MNTTENYAQTIVKVEHRADDDAEYEYKLTVRKSDVTAGYKLPLYSVEVSMTSSDGKTTSAKCKDAFIDMGRALVFFDKIVRCNATPIDLAYVYEDELN